MIHWKAEGAPFRQGFNVNARSNSQGMAITLTLRLFNWVMQRTWISWNNGKS